MVPLHCLCINSQLMASVHNERDSELAVSRARAVAAMTTRDIQSSRLMLVNL